VVSLNAVLNFSFCYNYLV